MSQQSGGHLAKMEASSAERRSEIYTYEAPHPVFAMNWSVSP